MIPLDDIKTIPCSVEPPDLDPNAVDPNDPDNPLDPTDPEALINTLY